MDGLLQPRIGGLYHGVSRQADLQRSPSQMQDLDNFLPSVDYAGFVDRCGTKLINALAGPNYSPNGHHFFRTTDGSRWVLLRRIESGTIEVRNMDTGVQAAIAIGPYVQNYIGTATDALRFLTISDTTLILNTTVPVQAVVPAKPELTSAYLVIKRTSTAAQTFTATSSAGSGQFALPKESAFTRDFVALSLAQKIAAGMPGVTAFRVAPNVVRVSGAAAVIGSLVFTNDWDDGATVTIKGRVAALSDLPPSFEPGVPVMVDLGQGDAKSSYYVQYDAARNAWVECSYAVPITATTGQYRPETMPIRLHQTGPAAFELLPCDWTQRSVGDDDNNPLAGFVGKRISALARWKGRLWFASGDTLYSTQADDIFNFWRSSAREVLPADPITLPIEADDVADIEWLVGFRSKLMVLCDNAQLEVPGEDPVTPTSAVIGVATRYQLDGKCEPKVIGDALYYTGPMANRSALWEYQYEQQTSNNFAEDLSKHVPGYVPGHVVRIRGASQAGRVFMQASQDPGTLYLQTSFWKDGQRQQNAWSRLHFAGIDTILSFWVYGDSVFLAGTGDGQLKLLSFSVEAGLGQSLQDDVRLDYRSTVQLTWNEARRRTEIVLPPGYSQYPSLVVLVDLGDGWFREFTASVVNTGSQWLAHFAENTGKPSGLIGLRYVRTATFSPFYPTVGDKTTPLGRLQVSRITVDCMVSCDFKATVKRPDRIDMVKAVSPRLIGSALVPRVSRDDSMTVPFNAQGHKASLSLTTTSTGPLCVTGLTLQGRYTNPRL
ncbi:phage nozzle protein [Achromobacter aegrifaciens]